jgi:hypothetical protein
MHPGFPSICILPPWSLRSAADLWTLLYSGPHEHQWPSDKNRIFFYAALNSTKESLLLYMENLNLNCILRKNITLFCVDLILILLKMGLVRFKCARKEKNMYLTSVSQKQISLRYDLPYFKLNLNILQLRENGFQIEGGSETLFFGCTVTMYFIKLPKSNFFLPKQQKHNHLWACSHYCAQARVPMAEVPRHWF